MDSAHKLKLLYDEIIGTLFHMGTDAHALVSDEKDKAIGWWRSQLNGGCLEENKVQAYGLYMLLVGFPLYQLEKTVLGEFFELILKEDAPRNYADAFFRQFPLFLYMIYGYIRGRNPKNRAK